MTSSMAEQGAPTRHKSSGLLSRLRCGLQTRLSCTAGLSCKPSTSSESSSNLSRGRIAAKVDPHVEAVSGDRKRLRSRDGTSSSGDFVASADSGVGRLSETLNSASCATSVLVTSGLPTPGHVTSGLTPRSTYDIIGRRRKRRSTQLTTVSELDVPETEMVTCSRGRMIGNDVIEPLMRTRPRRNHFYGKEVSRGLCFCLQIFKNGQMTGISPFSVYCMIG